MKKIRAWSEEWLHRSVSTPEGPVVVHRGQIVVLAVVDSWESAAKVMALLEGKTKESK